MFLAVLPSTPVSDSTPLSYVNFFVDDFLPSIVRSLSSMQIAPGVSLFAFLIAVALLCIVIGGILIR